MDKMTTANFLNSLKVLFISMDIYKKNRNLL